MDLEGFKAQFRFDSSRTLKVGIEREYFLVDGRGHAVPEAPRVLRQIHEMGWARRWRPWERAVRFDPGVMIDYELSACQVETKTLPIELRDVQRELQWQDRELRQSVRKLGLSVQLAELWKGSLPLDVYPDETGRYAKIAKGLSPEALDAAARVAGTHVHIGMPNHEAALKVYNKVILKTERLLAAGDESHGKRLKAIEVVKPKQMPVPIESWEDLYEMAAEEGLADDPRSMWTWIRISTHGTIEFRMFGANRSIKKIAAWADRCHRLCRKAMR